MTSTLRANVRPHEVLFSCEEILIDSDQPLDAQSAQDGILVQGERGQVALSKDGRQASWTPLVPLATGGHLLTISGLFDPSGEPVAGSLEIPFFLTDSQAKLPADLVVESMVRLEVRELGTQRLNAGQRPEGAFIEVMKASSRETGQPQSLGFDQDGQPIDTDEVFAQIAHARAKKYGKFHPSLFERLEKAEDQESVATAIWLESPAPSFDRLEMGDEIPKETPPEVLQERQQIAELTGRFVENLGQRGVEEARADRLAPAVYASLTGAQIRELAQDQQVLGLFLHEVGIVEDLQNSIEIARTDDVHSQGYYGSDIKVAVWERGPDNTSDLDISAQFDANPSTSRHARLTHAIIKNVEQGAPHGHASECELHSANDPDHDALAWAADENCTVMSQSFHRPDEPHSGFLSFDDIWKDWMALRWPYPTIVQAAGNFWDEDPDEVDPPSSEFVNHKGYNSLAIGSHNDDASAMAGSSVFRNPTTLYGDRELPELCANGTRVEAVGVPWDETSGTSFATPAVAGATALMQEVSPTLKHWPEACRAILLAGAQRNVSGNTWWSDVLNNVDASDGSGALDSKEGVEIAKNRRFRNAPGTMRGWHFGFLDSNDFGTDRISTFSYQARVPTGIQVAWRVKVALAWTSKLGLNIGSQGFPWIFELLSDLTVDLDLQVFDSNGNQVGYSGSWDNSYEIAEFTGWPGETYTIKIRRWTGIDDTTYGIAWNIRPMVFQLP